MCEQTFAARVIDLEEYRRRLREYLNARMHSVRVPPLLRTHPSHDPRTPAPSSIPLSLSRTDNPGSRSRSAIHVATVSANAYMHGLLLLGRFVFRSLTQEPVTRPPDPPYLFSRLTPLTIRAADCDRQGVHGCKQGAAY